MKMAKPFLYLHEIIIHGTYFLEEWGMFNGYLIQMFTEWESNCVRLAYDWWLLSGAVQTNLFWVKPIYMFTYPIKPNNTFKALIFST